MNIIHSTEYDRGRHAFLFNGELKHPLVLIKKDIRSEKEYDSDPAAESTALGTIRTLVMGFDGNVYSVVSRPQPVKAESFLARKSILPPDSGLRKLDQRKIEARLNNGLLRMASVFSLTAFDWEIKDSFVLGHYSNLFILSRKDIDSISPLVRNWLATERDSSFAFNCDAIVRDLITCDDTALMRYFPADNGRHEMIVIVGNETFVSSRIQKPLNSCH
jgi:hypothetical protein